jgi:hypothetical protein
VTWGRLQAFRWGREEGFLVMNRRDLLARLVGAAGVVAATTVTTSACVTNCTQTTTATVTTSGTTTTTPHAHFLDCERCGHSARCVGSCTRPEKRDKHGRLVCEGCWKVLASDAGQFYGYGWNREAK